MVAGHPVDYHLTPGRNQLPCSKTDPLQQPNINTHALLLAQVPLEISIEESDF